MRAFAVAAIVVVQAGAALAQAGCPVAGDLARGIRIDFADGSWEVFRDVGQGVVEVAGVDAEGFGYQMELGQGLHLMMYVNAADGVPDATSQIDYDYGQPLAALPLPVAGGRWASAVTVADQYGSRSEPQTHVWGPGMTVDIGGCSYDAIEAQISYKTGDGYVESVEFLPALGFGYLVWNESDAMDRFPVRPVAISLVGKK